ncbi:MAG TPA: hypothetical protein VF458_24340 [Ktedonobacteraceae bacterium]
MKLNENGDFCLLYIEPADEKHSLFATIGEQQKPVVLMLPLTGQPRSRLFQRPEDFSDLKHVRRQSGVSIVFLTSGSERLAQMAARYGFPAYASIDDFAHFLAHGHRAPREENEAKLNPPPLRRVRTGPLMPSAAVAQLAALRKPIVTRPLNMRVLEDPWLSPTRGALPSTDKQQATRAYSEPWTGHKNDELPATPLTARGEQPDLWYEVDSGEPPASTLATWEQHGFWESSSQSSELPAGPAGPASEHVASNPWGELMGEQPANGSWSESAGSMASAGFAGEQWVNGSRDEFAGERGASLQNGREAGRSLNQREMGYEYTAAFHEALTGPLGNGAARMAWPLPGEDVSSVLSGSQMPSQPGRVHGYQGPFTERGLPLPEENPPAPRPASEIPRRRSAYLPAESHTRHPGWQAEERMFEPGQPLAPSGPPVAPGPAQGHRSPARPTRDLREQSLRAAPGFTGAAPSLSPTRAAELELTIPLPDGESVIRSRSLANAPAAPSRPLARVAGADSARPSQAQAQRQQPQKRGGVWPLLLILSLLIISGGALGSFVAIARVMPSAPTAPRPVGSITFLSSEQLNENTSQGIDDQVQISLHSLGMSAPGKSYYAWLLGDANQSEAQSILLGKLSVSNGSASLFYAGDALHTNLLQLTSRFLVTEEDGAVTPLMPSPDAATWRYYGTLPAIPDPTDAHHYSFLNHLRHLLADEPILDELELPGGLNNWFSRNAQELMQLTSSARDRWQSSRNPATTRAQGIQLLAYLDGMSFVMQDVPDASSGAQAKLDTHRASLGLLNVRGDTQNPPGYLAQIVYHLNGLLNAPGSPNNVRAIANQILPAMSDVTNWLQKLRDDDRRLLSLADDQLSQNMALSLLDDMVLQASNAYSGNTDTTAGKIKPGASWIHDQLQGLASININTYAIGQTPVPEVAPSAKSGPAFLLPLLNAWREVEQWL